MLYLFITMQTCFLMNNFGYSLEQLFEKAYKILNSHTLFSKEIY